MNDLLASAGWLVEHHADPGVRVLDPRRPEDYAKGHVPGALSTNTPFKGPDAPLHVMTAPEAQDAFRALGISDDTHVVVMGDGMLSGRVWFVLRLYGQRHTCIADGGYAAYIAAGGRSMTDAPGVMPGTFTARGPDESLIVRAGDLVKEIGTGTKILDVRSVAEWHGSNTMDHKRVGHIPGASHLLWTELLTKDEPWLFRSPEEIRAIAASRDVGPDDHVVTVCEAGWRASHSAFALRLAGFSDVRVYDGSMREWDNDLSLPLEPPPSARSV
ncbi:MAG: rhodanese-like domain-containing protein [Chloroflexota bacterium]|nr:rhodanese-like domain-containing protein [Chloroflexota bacterium]